MGIQQQDSDPGRDTIEPMRVSPILKWAGGKRLLLKTIADPILEHLTETGGRFIEPFLGGGAVALHLGLPNMIVNDAIEELIDFYRIVRDEPALVAWSLSALAIQGVEKDNYYVVRDMDPATLKPQMAAARMLYLNRLGFNGVYRVNKAGGFNVPYGKDKYRESAIKRKSRDAIMSLFPHKGKIEAVSRALATTHILCGDFEPVIARAQAGDLIYNDPPYCGTYDSYTAMGFTEADQERLAVELYRANQRGVTILLSNADTDLIRYLYDEWAEILPTTERRSINADTGGRDRVACVLIAAEGK